MGSKGVSRLERGARATVTQKGLSLRLVLLERTARSGCATAAWIRDGIPALEGVLRSSRCQAKVLSKLIQLNEGTERERDRKNGKCGAGKAALVDLSAGAGETGAAGEAELDGRAWHGRAVG